jgi:beta-lactam-binding protein with PASTA domain
VKLWLVGRYRDSFKEMRTRRIVQTPLRSNIVVYSALDLVAGLLRNQDGLNGIQYLAVGTGDPQWDSHPPTPDRRTKRLVNEIYRKAIRPFEHMNYDAGTGRLEIRVSFAEHEAPGPLREFGLFGGHASAWANTGTLINYVIHPVIDKVQPILLDREIYLMIRSDSALNGTLELINGLLANRPELSGIQYGAVGSGEETWDEASPEPDAASTRLHEELCRKVLRPDRDISYDKSTRTLLFHSTFEPHEAVGQVREFGLFGGHASEEPDSGYLFSHQIHPVVNKRSFLVLKRELRLTLGSDALVRVPRLIGKTISGARSVLWAEKLQLGTIAEEERKENIGKIIGQEPGDGIEVAAGTDVDITLAVSPRVVTPNVCGLMPPEAKIILESANLKLAEEPSSTEESSAPAGSIVQQMPSAGSRVAPQTTVAYAVAEPFTTVVPHLTGQTPEQATITVRQAKLALAPPPYDDQQSDELPGTIVDQNPAANKQVAINTEVEITLASPWMVKVPDIIRLRPQEASLRLREAAVDILKSLGRELVPPGLTLGAQTTVESGATAGTIVAQFPSAGEEAPLYGTVDIWLAASEMILVPSLKGLTKQKAATALKKVDLLLGKTNKRSDVAPRNTVIDQDPAAGVRVPRGSSVDVVLADYILVTVPDLIGKTVKYAREVLTSRGLILGDPREESSDQPIGTIIKQNPKAGKSVAQGQTIEVVIAVSETVQVPSVVGETFEEATSILEQNRLKIKKGASQENDQPPGTVVKQDPNPGTLVSPGYQVTVMLAKAPMVSVPRVIGEKRKKAEQIVKEVGLILFVEEEQESDFSQSGKVLSQKPEAGEDVPRGSGVGVVVAQLRVPSLIRLQTEQAQAILKKVGLRLEIDEHRESDLSSGTILEQVPVAGTPVDSDHPEEKIVHVVVSKVSSVEVPNIVSLTLEKARPRIEEKGLVLEVSKHQESVLPVGTVLDQRPQAGTRVAPGSRVRVVLAKARYVRVPSIIALTLEKARTRIEEGGLVLEVGERRESDQPAGTVLAQQPRAGTQVAPGSRVRAVLAKVPLLRVPSLIGLSQQAAKEKVQRLGLKFQVDRTQESERPAGTVIDQEPKPETVVSLGSRVVVVVAKPVQATVPKLVGLLLRNAESRVKSAKLKLVVGEQRESDQPVGTVIEQDPPYRKRVPVGSQVTVVVAKARLVTVPKLVSYLLRTAQRRAQDAGLRLVVGEERVSTQTPGKVIAQNPNQGVKVPLGSQVTVVVAKARQVKVPKVEGLLLSRAEAVVRSAGLRLVVGEEKGSSKPAGTVLTQEPKAGESVLRGSQVTVEVAKKVVVGPINRIIRSP